MRCILLILILIKTNFLLTQTTAISFELNGRPSNNALQDSMRQYSKNPFIQFIGEWTLKEDSWSQNWGGATQTIKIPHHHTISSQLNTENSLLSIIDGPEPNGHIFWSYNPRAKEVFHLSSFGTIRAGHGKGTINKKGDVQLKLFFEGEPAGTYRIYHYTWLNQDEYYMKSTQYDANNEPTGLFYAGTFIRLPSTNEQTIKKEIEEMLSILDNQELSISEHLKVYADNLVHMAPNNEAITNKEQLKQYLEAQKEYGSPKMKHQIYEIEELGNKILMRGGVRGVFYPKDGKAPLSFKTKNLFIFCRKNGKLLIEKVIYNSVPTE